MNLFLCTISFRHQLISIEEIASWARYHQFSGIELWGVHAKNLYQSHDYGGDWLSLQNLRVPMVSDYLPVAGEKDVAMDKASELCRLACRWGAKKIRTFAGNRGSSDVPDEQRHAWVHRMRDLCSVVDSFGLRLVVETHPNTLADTLLSTRRLVEEIDHAALRLNFDVIHVWESGAEPIDAFREFLPFIDHMHLKNVLSRELLGVFSPQNVYAPAGERDGMIRLFDGAYDFDAFLRSVKSEFPAAWDDMDASLEWFGSDVLLNLEHDARRLRQLEADSSEKLSPLEALSASLS